MSNRTAIRYAKAIFDTAKEVGVTKQINDDMHLVVQTLGNSAELSTFLQNPVFSVEVKKSALNEIFGGLNKESKSLIRLLAENKRLDILGKVAKAYSDLYNQESGVQKIDVITAIPLNAELEQKVIDKAKQFTDKKILIENKVDTSIIGGFILKIGDKQYNASVANKLQTLKRELIN
ncbi:MAG: ATP synthase F1 subunit delta [Bacteroidota bacterium]|nr:ATP synthase F1 subunit delta [Bacteroidota bacterium]